MNSLVQIVSMLVFGVPVVFLLVVGLLAVAMMRAKNRRTLGCVLAAELPGQRLRRWGMSALLLGVLVALVVAGPDQRVLGIGCLWTLPALGLAWLGPGFQDALLGEEGVQRGWYSRRFDELEEWRLAGDHLRFRLFGEWTAVPCPPAEQSRLRQRLERVNGGRESPFRD